MLVHLANVHAEQRARRTKEPNERNGRAWSLGLCKAYTFFRHPPRFVSFRSVPRSFGLVETRSLPRFAGPPRTNEDSLTRESAGSFLLAAGKIETPLAPLSAPTFPANLRGLCLRIRLIEACETARFRRNRLRRALSLLVLQRIILVLGRFRIPPLAMGRLDGRLGNPKMTSIRFIFVLQGNLRYSSFR